MRTIKFIIVHCAASRQDVTAATVAKWHTDPPRYVNGVNKGGNGWSAIGYHHVVRQTGQIEVGRPITRPGAHVRGHNADSIAICLSGGFGGVFDYTDEQLLSLELLVGGYLKKFPGAQVKGHNDFTNSKTCPNFDVGQWWSDLTRQAA